ncbi:MAG: glycoside hydrolase family 3 N-terminal domain-containing protein [Bacteroidota bacterium]
MKKTSYITLILLVLFAGCSSEKNNSAVSDENSQRVDSLLSEMTLEEKVGQMTQITLSHLLKSDSNGVKEPFRIDTSRLREALVDHHVGSILNCGGHANSLEKWQEIISTIQEMALNETRLKTPVLYGIDAIHGANYTQNATLFPQQIGQAATWNPEISRNIGTITAYETRASGIPWNFSPVLGLGREAAWPRFWETFGEDVHLSTVMGKALTEGYQGSSLSDDSTKVAACIKHYVGYSAPNSGKDRTPASIPERELREYFLPPFEASIKSGAKTIMVNSGEINGTPVHASKYLLTDLLKEELNFDGLVVSDWSDIHYLHDRHKVASTQKEAVKIAVNAGIDMSMVPESYDFYEYLVELVEEGEVPEERIDDAVRRILKVKVQLGLFEKPFNDYKNYPKFASQEFSSFNLNAAEESMTLLKNTNNVLPLNESANVLVTGPTANSMTALNGGWTYTWQGKETDKYIEENNTILEAIQKKIGKQNVTYVPGSEFDKAVNIEKASRAAQKADHVVLCLGEDAYCEKPGDINDLYLPEAQKELATQIAATGKPVTLILVEGRPRLISKFEEKMDGILMAYLPGNRGGDAIANVLFGDVNPSGKLPFTYPKYPNALETYDRKHTENLGEGENETSYNPQFEFGHGLSYTDFTYSNLQVSDSIISEENPVEITLKVKNEGERKGKEAILLFISDHYASITPSVKKLKRFKKITLDAGEEKTVGFSINNDDLAFMGKDNNWITEKGRFTVSVGNLKTQIKLE